MFVSSPGPGTIRLILLVAWKNITFHAPNAVFVVIEVTICRVPMPWGHLLLCVITLGLYLGLAYLVHAIQNWYGTVIITVYPSTKLLDS